MTRKVSAKLYLSILATGLMAFCGVLIETAMNVTFPTLMKQFQVNTGTIQWLTTGYLLVVSIIVPISGFLKRRFTTKQLFLTATAFFILGLAICSVANDFALLLIGRLIQGCGTGITLPLMFNIILEQAPLDKIGFLMGIGTLVTAIAPALGPTYGGVLVDLNWHLIFIFLLVVMVIALFLGLFSITQVTKPVHVHLDVIAWLLIAIFFAGAILGLNRIENAPGQAAIYGVVAVLGLVGYAWRSLHVKEPLINLRLLKNWSFDWHVVTFLIIQIINVGFAFVLPNYLQLVNHTSSFTAGLLLLPGAALGACMAPMSGKLYDNLGPGKPIFIGLALQLVGILLLLATALTATPVILMLGYAAVMLGTGFAMGNIMTSGQAQLTQTETTDGNAIFNTMQQFSAALGTACVSLIVALAQVPTATAHSTAIGAQHAFWFLLILAIMGDIAIAIGLKTRHAQNQVASHDA
ncbi:MFS transporter [Lacticaseibacillus zeae]|uniref:MFS transporter n=1 Tax=Lacticaseibacillus zeae subsp. silagei TaxID=3068307 RepID=A0ABD7Z8Q2_LACZE|nr:MULTISPECIES: MFS transporter [Lacticaseibacillus]MDE3316530.1 MFS transporter [Lacticaseibacillus zeae]WLV83329.1 MFS transporter [Lacticaseibacillus sp. NCIMB 15475]WLV86077.1 MFS transporter [Lacticaseibacillus sp. NCIMB 15474]